MLVDFVLSSYTCSIDEHRLDVVIDNDCLSGNHFHSHLMLALYAVHFLAKSQPPEIPLSASELTGA